MLSDFELRQAAVAYNIVQEKGDPHEFEYIMARCHDKREHGPLGNPESIGFPLTCSFLARDLAGVLGESKERCERAVQEAFGGGDSRERQIRDRFNALIAYAAEVTGGRPAAAVETAGTIGTTEAPRPIVRIVLDDGRAGA